MPETEKPRSKSDEKCPFFKKAMRKVCHTCALWQHIKGRHPQTGEPLEHWGCVYVHNFMLSLENNKVTYEQGAAVESLRNELVEYQRLALRVAHRGDPETLRVIEGEFRRLDTRAAAHDAKQLGAPTVVHVPDDELERPGEE